MSKKEQWIDHVFQSVKHIERAVPQKDLFDDIMAQIKTTKIYH